MNYTNLDKDSFPEAFGLVTKSLKDWKESYSKKSLYFYIVRYRDFENINYVPSKIIKTAKLYKNFYIVLNNSYEGYAYKNFKYVHSFVEKNLLHNKLVYLCAHSYIDTEYDSWKTFNKKPQCFYVAHFNTFLSSAKKMYYEYNNDFLKPKEIWFSCLNHRPHHHRLATVTYLDYLNLLDCGIVTAHDRNYEPGVESTEGYYDVVEFSLDFWEERYSSIIKNQMLITENKLPLIYDLHDKGDACKPNDLNPEIYGKCLINLVTETYYLNHWNSVNEIFISEKTIKPILANQIFIMVGPMGMLHHLRKMGFKTFDNIIDESYDTLPDSTRLFKAVDAMNEVMSKYSIAQLDDLTRDIRKHNFKHYIKSNFNINLGSTINL